MRDNLPGLGWGDVHLAPKKSLVATACVVEVAVVDNQLLDLRQCRGGTSIQNLVMVWCDRSSLPCVVGAKPALD